MMRMCTVIDVTFVVAMMSLLCSTKNRMREITVLSTCSCRRALCTAVLFIVLGRRQFTGPDERVCVHAAVCAPAHCYCLADQADTQPGFYSSVT